jgi:hypothetical protein
LTESSRTPFIAPLFLEIKAPRNPQRLHSQTDQSFSRLEAQERFDEPQLGQSSIVRVALCRFGWAFFLRWGWRVVFLVLLGSFFLGIFGFGTRWTTFVVGLICCP